MTKNNPDEVVDRINGAFALVVYSLSRGGHIARADKLIKCIQDLYDDTAAHLKPNTTALNAMLNHWAKQGKVNLVSNLLKRMMENGRKAIAPNNVSFNILAYAKQGDPQGASEIVHVILDRYKHNQLSHPPDVVTFNILLDAWAKSGDSYAGERAEEVLQWMEREQVEPDTRSYNYVIDAYSKSGKPLQAEAILGHLMNLREGGSEVGPDEFSFTAVVHGWASHMHASIQSAKRASAIIQLMEDLQDSGYEGIAPDVSPYNALIIVWGASRCEGSASKVKDVLERIKRRPGIQPNSRTHSSTITALVASSENGLKEALECLYELEDRMDAGDASIRLDAASYNAILSGLVRNSRRDAVLVAERIRERMVQREQETGDCSVVPNTVTYNSLMNILTKARLTDSAERAEALLNEMHSQYESGAQHLKPTEVSFVTCISAWAKSNNFHKVPRAQAILERMKESYRSGNMDAKPTVLAYNALLNACSFPVGGADERAHSVSVVKHSLEELQDSDNIHPDHVTYATALKTFGRCLPPGERRDEIVEKAFESCCRDGQANSFVLSELRHASFNVYGKHCGKENPKDAIIRIPRQWRRNVSAE